MDLTGEDPDVVQDSSVKPILNQDGVGLADDGVLNGPSNKLANKSTDIDMGGVGLEVVLALFTKPVLNQDGVGFADERVLNGSLNELANKASKDIDMGEVGLKIVPALASKPVSNKGCVGFAGVVDLVNNATFNSSPSTQATLAVLKKNISL